VQHESHMMGVGQPLDAVFLIGTGLAISVGHCLGMCGPLVASLAGGQRARQFSLAAVARAQLLHHAGRILSYAFIGFLLASIGSTVRLASVGRAWQGALSLAVGGVMIVLGIGLLGWLPTRRWIESGRLAGLAVRAMTKLRDSAGAPSWFLIGMTNGLLPCGPVYAVAAGTVTATPLAGAAAMILFGLGTVPALLVFALGAGRLSPVVQRRFNRVAAVLVILIGVQLASRGAAALGWIGHFRIGELVVW
jgi:sulfite exporter TauE/SafE